MIADKYKLAQEKYGENYDTMCECRKRVIDGLISAIKGDLNV